MEAGEGSGGAWNAAIERRSGNAGQRECDVGKRWYCMVARTLERALANGGGSLERSRTTAWTMRREILIAAGRISLGSNAVKWQFELGDGGAQARAAERRGFVGVPWVEDMKRRVWRRRVVVVEAPCKRKLTWMLLLLLLLLVWEKGV